jgi:hypothetical protein
LPRIHTGLRGLTRTFRGNLFRGVAVDVVCQQTRGYAAGKFVLGSIFETGFAPADFEFRPKRHAPDVLELIRVKVDRSRDDTREAPPRTAKVSG